MSLDPRVRSIFRSERPPRKATASKHSRFTLVRFALFASRKMWLGGGQRVFDSLSCVPVLVGWNRRAVSPLPSLRLPSDPMPLVCSKGTEVTRRYERPSRLGVAVFVCYWAIVPHRQSYAVAWLDTFVFLSFDRMGLTISPHGSIFFPLLRAFACSPHFCLVTEVSNRLLV